MPHLILGSKTAPQVGMREPQRAYTLAKARAIQDARETIGRCQAAAIAKSRVEASQRRVEASPSYLKRRVQEEWGLPWVRVNKDSALYLKVRRERIERRKGQKKRLRKGKQVKQGAEEKQVKEEKQLEAVVDHVLNSMKPDLVVELLAMMRPAWVEGEVGL